jgi:hypothetical protein
MPKFHPHLSVTLCICNTGRVKLGLKEIGCEGVGWFPLTLHRRKGRILLAWNGTLRFQKRKVIS